MNELTFIADFSPTKDDPVEFLSKLRTLYNEHYGKWYQEWDEVDGEITLDLRTGGWSENEAIIETLLDNDLIDILCYHSWTRGGQHVFKFDYKPEP